MFNEHLASKAKRTSTGREYVGLNDYMNALDETAIAVEEDNAYIRAGERQASNTPEELHAIWAITFGCDMSAEDYAENVERLGANFGPRPHHQLVTVDPLANRPRGKPGG